MRFKLRTIFAIVTVAAVVIAIATSATRDWRKRIRIQAELTALGASYVGFNENGDPTWASFSGPVGSAEISKYDSLRQLDLAYAHVTDESMKHIAGLKQLHMLHMTESDITDQQLKLLARIGSLRILRIGRTRVTDEAIESIAQINGLTAVDLSGTLVTDTGVEYLERLRPGIVIGGP